jgi:hypothetical protein
VTFCSLLWNAVRLVLGSQVQTDPGFVLSQWDKLKAAIVTIQVSDFFSAKLVVFHL